MCYFDFLIKPYNRARQYFRINLRSLHGCMTQQLLDGGYRHSMVNQQRGTGMAAGMVGDVLLQPCQGCYPCQ